MTMEPFAAALSKHVPKEDENEFLRWWQSSIGNRVKLAYKTWKHNKMVAEKKAAGRG